MTRFSKVLVVFVAAASLSFFAFVGALLVGGPNWSALADQMQNTADYGRQVTFKAPDVPKGSWTVTHTRSNTSIGTDPLLPAVILKAQDRILKDLRDELADLKAKIEAETAARDLANQTIAADHIGIKARATAYEDQLKKLATEVATATESLAQKGVDLTVVQKQFEERRFEVFRLQSQLELLRDDLFAAQRQRDALLDELLQLKESQQRLSARQQQLKRQLGAGEVAAEDKTIQ